MPRFLPLAFAALAVAAPAGAQQLPVGQGEAEYRAWLEGDPAARGAVLSFEAWQEAAGVAGILPTYQITRTASMWAECGGPPFEVAPPALWPNVARTLRFVRDHVVPVIGPVEAVSGYRNPPLNACARGAATSAHVDYAALDLVPVAALERDAMIRAICAIHAFRGREAGIGLGFYAFRRFHVDSRSFRRWGPDGRAESTPCTAANRDLPAPDFGQSG
ncbi:MAG: D-Ala-D-Ala carboxypeptidase family metallohydrolase [Allosphingosinicella sp.]|uniref:D-Ala-D-Ala carboxypeptidase family metallohydrolase n=1 Tax=Allosphingosinicella sp. TaxID=2823234 RepID=UPI0039350AA5